jgi:hypothetical protein
MSPRRRLGPVRHTALAAEIVATYATVRILLWRRTRPETVAALRRGLADDAVASEASLSLGRHLASATVRTITLLPADSRCLMRSLVLLRVLARRGLGATLVLSAAPGPPLEAHAWVEHAGEPLLAPGQLRHQPLARL